MISTLSICCSFASVVFLTDASRFLFTPQALAVVFAMLASYVLSRTLIPILIDMLVASEHASKRAVADPDAARSPSLLGQLRNGFETRFNRFSLGYVVLLRHMMQQPAGLLTAVGGTLLVCAGLLLFLGSDYFPQIDAGAMQLHVRGRPGLRIEETERLFQEVEDTIHSVIPARDFGMLIDDIGLPSNTYNLGFPTARSSGSTTDRF